MTQVYQRFQMKIYIATERKKTILNHFEIFFLQIFYLIALIK
jgi:hypothetical protein